MTLYNKIKEEVKISMKAKDSKRTQTLRLITSSIKQIEVDKRLEEKDITDSLIIEILSKMIKQRKESINSYTLGNRLDLVEQEEYEINIINEYMPKQMKDYEVTVEILKAYNLVINNNIKLTDNRNELTIKDIGKIMSIIKPIINGKFDNSVASNMVKEYILNSKYLIERLPTVELINLLKNKDISYVEYCIINGSIRCTHVGYYDFNNNMIQDEGIDGEKYSISEEDFIEMYKETYWTIEQINLV
jgi:uncharacterized protein YqeY